MFEVKKATVTLTNRSDTFVKDYVKAKTAEFPNALPDGNFLYPTYEQYKSVKDRWYAMTDEHLRIAFPATRNLAYLIAKWPGLWPVFGTHDKSVGTISITVAVRSRSALMMLLGLLGDLTGSEDSMGDRTSVNVTIGTMMVSISTPEVESMPLVDIGFTYPSYHEPARDKCLNAVKAAFIPDNVTIVYPEVEID